MGLKVMFFDNLCINYTLKTLATKEILERFGLGKKRAWTRSKEMGLKVMFFDDLCINYTLKTLATKEILE
jgi:hypothetical protein